MGPKTLEPVIEYYIIFIIISQCVCFAHQKAEVLVGRASELTDRGKDDVVVYHVFCISAHEIHVLYKTHFYKKHKADIRQKLRNILKKHRLAEF